MIHHTEHLSDFRTAPGKLTRRIGHWINYRTPYGGWGGAAPNLLATPPRPENWDGEFDLDRYSQRGALQIGVGDTSDPDNRAMFGLRRADQPDAWINLKAYDGVQAVSPSWDPGGLISTFTGLWPNADVSFTANRHRIEKIIEMAVGAPLVYRWTLREAPGVTHEWLPNGDLLFRNAAGDPVFMLPAPWATDANGDSVPVTLTEEAPVVIGGHSYAVLKLTVDDTGAVYPIRVDPTAMIFGTTDIQDTSIITGDHGNYGGHSNLFHWVGQRVSLIRLAAAAIPTDGVITGFRLNWYHLKSWTTGQIFAHIITDANDWVEGSSVGGIQSGKADWFDTKHGTTTWAGSAGCGTSGVDFDTDATPPTLALNGIGAHVFTLKPEWPIAWRGVSPSRVANGIRFSTDRTDVDFGSTESVGPGIQPIFEVDYVVIPVSTFDFGKRKKNMRTDFVDLDAPQAPGEGEPVNVLEYTDKTVQITGNPTGLDVVIEGTMDGTNWAALTTSISAIGFETIAATVKLVRVKLNALTSGDYDVKFSGRLVR